MSELVTIHNQDKVTLLVENKTNVITVFRGEKGDSGNTFRRAISITVDSDGQTIVPLTINPPLPSETSLTVNGIEYDFGSSYSLSNYQLTWLNDPFLLTIRDRIKLYY